MPENLSTAAQRQLSFLPIRSVHGRLRREPPRLPSTEPGAGIDPGSASRQHGHGGQEREHDGSASLPDAPGDDVPAVTRVPDLIARDGAQTRAHLIVRAAASEAPSDPCGRPLEQCAVHERLRCEPREPPPAGKHPRTSPTWRDGTRAAHRSIDALRKRNAERCVFALLFGIGTRIIDERAGSAEIFEVTCEFLERRHRAFLGARIVPPRVRDAFRHVGGRAPPWTVGSTVSVVENREPHAPSLAQLASSSEP